MSLQRQSRERHAIRRSFSTAIASRFYTDGSLARQKRVAECNRRRQERLKAKADVEWLKTESLRRAYEAKKELEERKREREMDRAQRRVRTMSAEVIQHAWRRVYHERLWRHLYYQAAVVIQTTLRAYLGRRHALCFCAARMIQQWWVRTHRQRAQVAAASVLHRALRCFLHRHHIHIQKRKSHAAMLIQRAWTRYWRATREAAASTIQRWIRMKQRRGRKIRLARMHQHLQSVERMHRSATILQWSLGRYVAQCRVRRDAAFQRDMQARQHVAVTTAMKEKVAVTIEHGDKGDDVWTHVHEREKHLKLEEARLRGLIKDLREVQIPQAQARRADERESLRRWKLLQVQWKEKEKAWEDEKKREAEEQVRRDIRLEMEKKWDADRRWKHMNMKKPETQTRAILRAIDSRIEGV